MGWRRLDSISSRFLPTPSARRATRRMNLRSQAVREISTHALREEGDRRGCRLPADRQAISTHALREEGDLSRSGPCHHQGDFYPRPPRGGRPCRADVAALPRLISTHALREEGDDCSGHRPVRPPAFLPTPSARRATAEVIDAAVGGLISTHALREEGDFKVLALRLLAKYFYPRPPRGGRQLRLSTLP